MKMLTKSNPYLEIKEITVLPVDGMLLPVRPSDKNNIRLQKKRIKIQSQAIVRHFYHL